MTDDFEKHTALQPDSAPHYVITALGIENPETKAELKQLVNVRKVDMTPLAEVMWTATKAAQADRDTYRVVQAPSHYVEQAIEERKTDEGRARQHSMYLQIKLKSNSTNNVLNPSKLINASVDLLKQMAKKFPPKPATTKQEGTATATHAVDKQPQSKLPDESAAEKPSKAESRVAAIVNLHLKDFISPETADALKKLDMPELAAVLWAAKSAKEASEKVNTPTTSRSARSSLDDLRDKIDGDLAKNPVAETVHPVEHFITAALHQGNEDRTTQLQDLERAKRLKVLGGGIKTDDEAIQSAVTALTKPKSQTRLLG